MSIGKSKLVITRPLDKAEQLVSVFSDIEFDAEQVFFIEPMLSIVPVVDDRFQTLDSNDYDGVLITSANAIHHGISNPSFSVWKGKPLFVVGEQTAIRAREAGFQNIQSVFADVADLKKWFEAQQDDAKSKLIYLRGEVVSADLAADLKAYGNDVDEIVTYRAIPSGSFSQEFVSEVQAENIGGITFFSRRTVVIFMSLAIKSSVLKLLRDVPVYCISENVASYVRESFNGPVEVASSPDREAMVKLIQNHFLK